MSAELSLSTLGQALRTSNPANTWLHKKRATKKELQSLVEKLNWAAKVVRGGHTFLRRLIDIMCTLKRTHHHIRLSSSAQADVTWWATFISQFNGTLQFIL